MPRGSIVVEMHMPMRVDDLDGHLFDSNSLIFYTDSKIAQSESEQRSFANRRTSWATILSAD